MILPIYTYGNTVLRKKSAPVDKSFADIKSLVDNMFETMHNAKGVGLAAPQIGQDIRVFVADLAAFEKDDPELAKFKIAMINPEMLEISDETEAKEEGCLSIPGINENVPRAKRIKVKYLDTDFVEHIDELTDYKARVVQHEYDHLEGRLFTDKVSPLRRQLIRNKLTNIEKHKTKTDYKIK